MSSPKYVVGHAINIAMLCLAFIFTTITMLYVRFENNRRATGARDYRLAEGDEGLLGHRHPRFRYTL